MDLNPNSMLYWFPKIVRVNVPKPRTILVQLDPECFISEGGDPVACKYSDKYVSGLADLIDTYVLLLGGYPVFLRTDYTSCKHYYLGEPLYKIRSSKELKKKLITMICECHEILCPERVFLPPMPNGVAIREWIDFAKWTDKLERFYKNIEVRVFTRNGDIEKVYPYYHWSGIEKLAIGKDRGEIEELRREYRKQYVEKIILGLHKIVEYARKITSTPGIRDYDWSIDFALANNEWYFIDMALANQSWRPEKETEEDKVIAEKLANL